MSVSVLATVPSAIGIAGGLQAPLTRSVVTAFTMRVYQIHLQLSMGLLGFHRPTSISPGRVTWTRFGSPSEPSTRRPPSRYAMAAAVVMRAVAAGLVRPPGRSPPANTPTTGRAGSAPLPVATPAAADRPRSAPAH